MRAKVFICPAGTMLFGTCNDYPAAARLLSISADAGAAFFDTAEMYPVPQSAETSGRSEEFLGRWLAGRPRYMQLLYIF